MSLLPQKFDQWFEQKGWHPRPHQIQLFEIAEQEQSALLIAPTGAGKTLAGFLPTLVDLARTPTNGLHTIYISPLKALSVDVARNLTAPVEQMDLDISIETRTGDTPSSKRQRQRYAPPNILLTTPEQIALMLSHPDADKLFANVKRIVLDELHALVTSKRGELLSLGLARLHKHAPNLSITALSATVAQPDVLRDWVASLVHPQQTHLLQMAGGVSAQVQMLKSAEHVPWAGHSATYAYPELYEIIKKNKTSLLFVNTRSQAEMLFQSLWQLNEDDLPIALHHGSLDVEQRRKIEAAMTSGRLRAVVCTSTLDLGIDWGDVDLVMQIGAPKGASRMLQRIGRANHRLDEPSRAVLVPSNRFEILECQAALDAIEEGAQDSEQPVSGGLDVLAQHVLGMACAAPFHERELFEEITRAWPYRELEFEQFSRVVQFVADGGYALQAYERYAKLRRTPEQQWRLSNPRFAQQYRLNMGTIIEEPMIRIRLVRARGQKRGGSTGPISRGGRVLGEMEEYFISQLEPGDTFLFGGEIVAFEAMRENEALVSKTFSEAPKIPSYMGGKFPLSTFLADRVRKMVETPKAYPDLPAQVQEWMQYQQHFSMLPKSNQMLVETFPRGDKSFLVCYPFEGRLAHQTMGMLLTKRLERARARPLGFVASEYALAIWGLGDLSQMVALNRLSITELFSPDMLGDDLEEWLEESSLMRRTFRNCAMIGGLIERRHPGKEKTGRQMTISSDILFDVLKEHEPDHILLQATRRDAARGLLDIERLNQCLGRISKNIVHRPLKQISPFAVPVMLEIGKEPIFGEGREEAMAEAADELFKEATG